MLKNHAFELRMVKNNNRKKKSATDEVVTTESESVNPEVLIDSTRELINDASVVITSAVVTTTVVRAVCKIAVIIAKAKL